MRLQLTLIVVLFFLPAQSWAANAYVQSKANSTGASSAATVAVTLDSPVTPGNLVIVTISEGSVNLTGVTDNLANTYELASTYRNGGASFHDYYLKNAPNAPQTFTASLSPNTAFLTIMVHEVSGAHATAPYLGSVKKTQTAPGTGSNVVTSPALTPGVNGAYVLGVAYDRSGLRAVPQFTAGTSPNVFTKTAVTGSTSLSSAESEYFIQPSSASIAATFTFTHASDNTTTLMSLWAPAGGAGGPIVASSHYVDTAATGTGTGASWANAWTTRAAIDEGVIRPGDTVYFSGGTSGKSYNSAVTWSPPSGSAGGGAVTFKVGQDAGHTGMVTFTKTGSSGPSEFVSLTTSRYVTFDGEVAGNRRMTFGGYGYICYTQNQADKHARFLYLEWTEARFNCQGSYMELAHSVASIYTSVSGFDFLVTQFGTTAGAGGYGINSLHHNRFTVNRKTGAGEGFDVLIWSMNTDIHDNTMLSVSSGYTGTQHNDGVQVSGDYMRIYNNYFENFTNYAIFNEWFSSQSYWRVYNNVVAANDASAAWAAQQCMAFGSNTGTPQTATDFIIANNTCRGNGSTKGIRFNTGSKAYTLVDIRLINNLSYNAQASETVLVGAGSPTVSNNVGGTANIVFVADLLYPNNNFRLTDAATAAIDQGIAPAYLTSVFTTDMFGTSRPTGAAWDVGAAEIFGTPPPSAPTGVRIAAFSGSTFAIPIWTFSADAVAYLVYRSTVSGTYGAPIATITAATAAASQSPMTQYIDKSLYTAGTYYYKIGARDVDMNISDLSSEASITVTGKQ